MDSSDVTILFTVAGEWGDTETKGQILTAISRSVCNCNIEIYHWVAVGSRQVVLFQVDLRTLEPNAGEYLLKILLQGFQNFIRTTTKSFYPGFLSGMWPARWLIRGKYLTHNLNPQVRFLEPQ